MTSKNKEAFSLETGINFFIVAYLLVKELLALFLLELQLAKRSAKIIFVLSVIFIFMCFSFWSLFLLICVLCFQSLLQDWILSVIITAGINVLCAGIVLWCLTEYVEDLKFLHIRKHLWAKKEDKHA